MDVNSTSLLGLHQATTLAQAQTLTPRERAEQSRLIQAVRAVNQSGIFGSSAELVFAFDTASKKTVMKLVNRETGEVVRQIPPEYVLRLSEDTERMLI